MPQIPDNPSLGYMAFFALVFGFFLILAGSGIITIEKIVVARGAKTWGVGIALVTIGILFLLPNILKELPQSATPTPNGTVAEVTSTVKPLTPTPQLLTMRSACGTTYTVASNTPIILQYGGWYARGLELGQNNADHLDVTLILDGQVISGQQQPVGPVSTSYPGSSCGSLDAENGFGTFYIASISSLSPGQHSVEVIYSMDEQVTDGYDHNNDGTPDPIGPGEVTRLEFIIIAEP